MFDQLIVPNSLHRNRGAVIEAGIEHTGRLLINLATARLGLQNLEHVDVLDIGCGVRFAMTIINSKIPIKSYTGVEVSPPIVEFLKDTLESYDKRFKFAHWNVRNEMYNPNGVELTAQDELPVAGFFDVIWAFGVFTHMNPKDSLLLLKLLRKKIRTNGQLFFSAYIDGQLDGFEDRTKELPLDFAYYGKKYMQSLIEQSGWKIHAFYERDPSKFIQHHFICLPV